MDAKGPIGKPEDVEDYLRNLGAKDWGASLDVAVLPRKRKVDQGRTLEPANDSGPTRKAVLPRLSRGRSQSRNRKSAKPSRATRRASSS